MNAVDMKQHSLEYVGNHIGCLKSSLGGRGVAPKKVPYTCT